jgi:RimJ/RimL family protein N-acetyltransferase
MAQWILETERLSLREFQPVDAQLLYLLNADPQVLAFTGDQAFESEAAAASFIKMYSDYRQNGLGRWTVLLKTTGSGIGWCGLKQHSNGLIDIGFRFLRTHWNKGYATEAASACLAYGFEQLCLNQIIGRAASQNRASIRVLEKIGMHFWKSGAMEGISNARFFKMERRKWISLH